MLPEHSTVHDILNQFAQRVIGLLMASKNCLDFCSVGKLEFAPGSKRDQLCHQISRHLRLRFHQVLFEVANVSELESILGLSRAIDWSAEGVVFRKQPQSRGARAFDVFALTVLLTIIANWVKALQSKTGWINPAVANGTGIH